MKNKAEFSEINTKEELLNLQRNFADIIRRPLLAKSKMRPDPRSEKIVKENDHTDPHGRMEFYAQQYWWRILDSFDSDFVCLSKVVDAKTYKLIRDSYLDKCHSKSFTLRNLGHNLKEFIRTSFQLENIDMNLVLDAVAFDWARIEAFDALAHEPLKVEDVSNPNFPERTLYLQPFVKLLMFHYEVDTLFKSLGTESKETTSNTSLERSENQEGSTLVQDVIKNRVYVAVYRREGKLASMRLSKEEFDCLESLKSGVTIIQMLEGFGDLSQSKEESLQLFFQKLMALSMITL